ncbi:hypothetical protein [Veillonella sp.]
MISFGILVTTIIMAAK